MESKAKVAGHPVHPMLVVFPLGLLATSFFFDIIRLAGASESWGVAAFYMIGAGIIGGLLSAVFGLVDWLAIPKGTRAKSVGAMHGVGNVVVTGLFLASWGIRYGNPGRPDTAAVFLSLAAVLLAVVTGWLGGELVDRLGVGVDDGAHLDAPSSLSHRPATERHAAASRPMEPRRA
ncbi:MAG TPA: DUF2231 domain-containing protein [Chloroflexota bacterium]|nr:DUF2231 domain-containing protein [Chloroflexota bacterium]